jgi:hypothetical protein
MKMTENMIWAMVSVAFLTWLAITAVSVGGLFLYVIMR